VSSPAGLGLARSRPAKTVQRHLALGARGRGKKCRREQGGTAEQMAALHGRHSAPKPSRRMAPTCRAWKTEEEANSPADGAGGSSDAKRAFRRACRRRAARSPGGREREERRRPKLRGLHFCRRAVEIDDFFPRPGPE